MAAPPFDWQLSDSYFVVAHFHYVLIGGLLFTIFAAIYYWFPKATGKMLSETLGRWHFWLLVIGFNLTFGPQHIAGVLGMPRRIYTYAPGRGWELWNLLSSVGVFRRWPCSSSCGTSYGPCARGRRQVMIRGTPGRWSGPRPPRRQSITLRRYQRCRAGGHSGT